MTLLEMNNISFVNPQNAEQRIIKGIDFQLDEGDFVSIIGTNGAGKSTLFNLITGGLAPTEGSVAIHNKEITHDSEEKRAAYFGRVFQDPKLGTAPRMTVLENLGLAQRRGQNYRLRAQKLSRKRAEFYQLCQQTGNGLEEKLDTPTQQLSGGQRQALSLLMATLVRPEVLLLDEHTAALDPKTSISILNLTQKIVTESQLTCLMITHNLDDALKFGNRLIALDEGRIVLDVKGQEKAQLTKERLLQLY